MKGACPVCNNDRVATVEAFSSLPRVTSDCKPWPAGGALAVCDSCGMAWKMMDPRFEEEVARIYDQYNIYALSQGVEQKVYTGDGSAIPRSRRLVDFLITSIHPGASGKLLDIGCGNGEALANFSRMMPGWSLHGSELSDKHLERLQRIDNFHALHTGPLNSIGERFDIISMIHVLEHLPEPEKFLREVMCLLAPGGQLLIEVPNIVTSPFDLLIADHLSHFSPEHLVSVVRRAGLSVVLLRDDVCPKEITLLATPREEVAEPPAGDPKVVRRRVAWLSDTLGAARQAANEARSFGIFGTSIAGMWLYGALSGEVSFFVDEDPSRIGSQYEGRPIFSPDDIPEGATVFVPMASKTAEFLVARLAPYSRGWVLPPVEGE